MNSSEFAQMALKGFMAGDIGVDVWMRRADFERIPYNALGHASIHEASHACFALHYDIIPIRAEVFEDGSGRVVFTEDTEDRPISECRCDADRIADITAGLTECGEPPDALEMQRETEELLWELWNEQVMLLADRLYEQGNVSGRELQAMFSRAAL
jgi:hypothetical protein